MIKRSLDTKLARILTDPSCQDFILADAKDADMAFGMAAPGISRANDTQEGRFRTLPEYRESIRQNVAQGLIDIMLMSASTSEHLTLGERLFHGSPVTPAIRANDTTDIWLASGSRYTSEPSQPFRTATIDHAMTGRIDGCLDGSRQADKPCTSDNRGTDMGADLGLYSITFNNDATLDANTLRAYGQFREEAERKGFRHFLEVFDPNCLRHPVDDLGRFMNDNIVRALAGVVDRARPLFLKIVYHGPAAMEQLAGYDPSLVIGILGGSSGTTFDAFHQLWEAKKYGARVALYGRMINHSEHQLSFIEHLRWLADGDLDDPAEAVRSYHAALEKLSITPRRPLSDDLQRTDRAFA
jgi:hypothetical protein